MSRNKNQKTKEILYGDAVRKKMLDGANKLADVVQVTLGPRGRNVMIQKQWGWPHTTKDGVSVAREVTPLKDPFENMAASYLQHAASQTNAEAGDGTTSTTILARAIYREGVKMVSSGHNPMEIKKGIEYATEQLAKKLKEISKELSNFEQVKQVATVSANGDESIGDLIANAMEQVGREGVITVDEGKTLTTELHVTEGMQFDNGYISPYFITNPKSNEATLDRPLILVYKGTISSSMELMPLLEQVAYAKRSLLLIAEDITADALKLLFVNKEKGTIQTIAVRAPGFGDKRTENIVDIATLVGATLLDPSMGDRLEDFFVPDRDINKAQLNLESAKLQLNVLGEAERVICTAHTTTILEGSGNPDQIEIRAEKIRKEMENITFKPELEFLNERLARLIGGVAVISVGAATETEMREKQDRIDDALSATRAAVQEGIVPGGGITLLRLSQEVHEDPTETHDFNIGIRIFKKACEEPLRLIVENSGKSAPIIMQKILDEATFEFGYNARTHSYGDLYAAGIIDPAKVVRCAAQNAASTAGLMLTTEAMIAEELDEKE